MHKKHLLSTSIMLFVFMVELTSGALAQTHGRPFHFNERYWLTKNPLVAAKAAAGRVARSHFAVAVPRSKAVGSFLTFDAPGASNSTRSGTFPTAISASGVITGTYDDANSLSHAFLRTASGRFVTFDVPGATGISPLGVNNEGAVTGVYFDNVGSGLHSFLRTPQGTIVTFDPPAATSGSGGSDVNPEGTIVGFYLDASFLSHGFLRTRSGRFVTIDAPGAANTPVNFGTLPFSITAFGLVLGGYSDANSTNFGYLMTPFGRFIQIAVPGGRGVLQTPFSQAPAVSINPLGVIAGTYVQPVTGEKVAANYRAFVRFPDGTYVTFDAADYPPCCIWSGATGIDPAGTIAGTFNDGFNLNHGFWRTRSGTVTTFDVPGAGTGSNEGTLPIGITAAGVIGGMYRDADFVTHGFLFEPK
jgi:hypothetical protein